MTTLAAFIDVGFLRGAVPGEVAPQAHEIANWAKEAADCRDCLLLRTYWYDGAFEPSHPQYGSQQKFLDAVRYTAGIYVRLGHIQEKTNKFQEPIEGAIKRTASDLDWDPDTVLAQFRRNWEWRPVREQKGVDTLLALDLVRLGQTRVIDVAVVVSGDRDLAEAVKTAQDAGVRVALGAPGASKKARAAAELRQIVDEQIDIDQETLSRLVHTRGDSVR